MTPTPTPPPGSSPFQSSVLPAFTAASCTNLGCHGNGSNQAAGSNPPGLNLQIGDGVPSGPFEDTAEYLYNFLKGDEGNTVYVNTVSPSNSLILTYPQNGTGHGGGNAWGGTAGNNYQAVLMWIQTGAAF